MQLWQIDTLSSRIVTRNTTKSIITIFHHDFQNLSRGSRYCQSERGRGFGDLKKNADKFSILNFVHQNQCQGNTPVQFLLRSPSAIKRFHKTTPLVSSIPLISRDQLLPEDLSASCLKSQQLLLWLCAESLSFDLSLGYDMLTWLSGSRRGSWASK